MAIAEGIRNFVHNRNSDITNIERAEPLYLNDQIRLYNDQFGTNFILNNNLHIEPPMPTGIISDYQRQLQFQQNFQMQQNLRHLNIPDISSFELPVYTVPPMINSYSFDNYRDPFEPQIPINIDVQPMHIYEPPVYIPPTPVIP